MRENLYIIINTYIQNSFIVHLRENRYLKREFIAEQRMIYQFNTRAHELYPY